MDVSKVIDSTSIESTARLSAALADPTRLRILHLLGRQGRCVCDLQDAAGVAPNLLSYHLRVLREAGMVTATRRGRWVDYRLDPEGIDALLGRIRHLIGEGT